jgi:hypothetical protein
MADPSNFNADVAKVVGLLGAAGAIGYTAFQRWSSTRKLEAIKSSVDLDTLSGYGSAMRDLGTRLEQMQQDLTAMRTELSDRQTQLDAAILRARTAEEQSARRAEQLRALNQEPAT